MNTRPTRIKPASVRYGTLFTEEEQRRLEQQTEKPLITFLDDRIWIAFDRSDTVVTIPIRRTDGTER